MENEKLIKQISTIQRGLGIIEGIASYLSNDAASQMRYSDLLDPEEAMEIFVRNVQRIFEKGKRRWGE